MMEQETTSKSPDPQMRSYLPEEPNVGSDAKRQEVNGLGGKESQPEETLW